MVYTFQFIIILLTITFAISSAIEIYSKILKRESKAFYGMVISLILFFPVTHIRNRLTRAEITEQLEISKITQGNPAFSKEELSDIHIVSEKIRTVGPDINVVLLPRSDTLCLNQDFHDPNKFWIHYKKYEFLKLTAPVGYVVKK